MLKTINIRTQLREQAETVQEMIRDMLPYFDNEGGIIIVRRAIHPGVKVLIGNAAMHIHNKIEHGRLRNIDGKVQVLPL